MKEITLSKAQRLQVLVLVITHTVAAKMLEETELSRNAEKVRARIKRQSQAILATFPAYGQKTLRQLTNATGRVWGVQGDRNIDAVTMLTLCLYLVEGVRFALKDAGRTPGVYAKWSRLAGSMFTMEKHLGDFWEYPNDPHQTEAVELGEIIRRVA